MGNVSGAERELDTERERKRQREAAEKIDFSIIM